MADDAFALSPIAARATQPSDEDYGAIYEAFMETSRGRWFLTEYARRNRNADTRAVLDAVARIEDALAQQKPQAEAAKPETAEPIPAAPDPRLAELEQRLAYLAAEICVALDAARNAMPAHEPGAGLEAGLAPIRHAGQMVQGVAWTLRESGADGRICTLLDQQAQAIAQALRHPDIERSSAPQADAAIVFAALEARIRAALAQEGIAPQAGYAPHPAQPRIIIPNDDFEIVEHADLMAKPASAEPADDPASTPAARDNAVSDFTNAAASVQPDPLNEKFSTASAESGADAPQEAITLGAVIADHTAKAASARSYADPLAPFMRMTKAEKIAFFS